MKVSLVMRQSEFNLILMPHILPTLHNETTGEEILSCLLQFLCVDCSVRRSATRHFTAHRLEDDLLFTSIINPPFSFLL